MSHSYLQMKRILLIFAAIGLLTSCDKDKKFSNTELIGTWKLIEVLADPGDGSGTFRPLKSDKTITFEDDGIISSNGNLCDMLGNPDHPTSGTYSISDMTFRSSDCSDPDFDFSFKQDGNILTIYYPCIEPCIAKYKKR